MPSSAVDPIPPPVPPRHPKRHSSTRRRSNAILTYPEPVHIKPRKASINFEKVRPQLASPVELAPKPTFRLQPAPPGKKRTRPSLTASSKSTRSKSSSNSLFSTSYSASSATTGSMLSTEINSSKAPTTARINTTTPCSPKTPRLKDHPALSLPPTPSSPNSFKPCTCTTCSPPSPSVLVQIHQLHCTIPPPSPPTPPLFSPRTSPLPFNKLLTAHATSLLQSGVGVEDIVRTLHAIPELAKYRGRISEGGVWEALRQGSGRKPSSPVSTSKAKGKGEEKEELDDDLVLLPPRGKRFEELCSTYWYESDMSLLEISRAVKAHGFWNVPRSFASNRQVSTSNNPHRHPKPDQGIVCTPTDITLALHSRSIKGGRELGGYANDGMDGWCDEARRWAARGLCSGMGIASATEYVRENGFGQVTSREIRGLKRWMEAETLRIKRERERAERAKTRKRLGL